MLSGPGARIAWLVAGAYPSAAEQTAGEAIRRRASLLRSHGVARPRESTPLVTMLSVMSKTRHLYGPRALQKIFIQHVAARISPTLI